MNICKSEEDLGDGFSSGFDSSMVFLKSPILTPSSSGFDSLVGIFLGTVDWVDIFSKLAVVVGGVIIGSCWKVGISKTTGVFWVSLGSNKVSEVVVVSLKIVLMVSLL